MKNVLTGLTICLALSLSAFSAQAATFTGYAAFGDSLIDDGKLGAFGPPPPFLDGRFTNGPTYAEIIGERFTENGLGYLNLGLGGATAGDVNANDAFYPAPALAFSTFNAQIDTFLALSALVGPDPLLSVALGANDIFQAGEGLTDPLAIGAAKLGAAVSAASAVVAGIERLFSADASVFDDFLLPTLPDLGTTPDGSADPAFGALVSDTYNATLLAGLSALETAISATGGSINLMIFDSDAFRAELVDNAALYGLENFEDSCVDNFVECLDAGINTYAFIDGVHPTAPVQQALADALLARLGDSVPAVPVPAGLPMLVGGLALFGLIRRRQAA